MSDMDDSKVRLSNFDLDFATQFKVTVNYDHLVQNMSLIMLGSRLKTQESTWKVDKKRAEKTFRSIAIGHVLFCYVRIMFYAYFSVPFLMFLKLKMTITSNWTWYPGVLRARAAMQN